MKKEEKNKQSKWMRIWQRREIESEGKREKGRKVREKIAEREREKRKVRKWEIDEVTKRLDYWDDYAKHSTVDGQLN